MVEPVTSIDRTLHGYGHGHDLLASSTVLDDATANILSHNSDSAPNAHSTDGPFITGYPLPDGRYVIARTWPDEVADRPNTVITLSLILPDTAKGVISGERILDHLSRPPQVGPERRLPPLDSTELNGPALKLSTDEATVGAQYYTGSQQLHLSLRTSRERVALAIWQQLWRSARFNLQFCTAPDTDRFSRAGRALRFQSDPTATFPPSDLDDCVERDLEEPGSFREFVHFVGSGERSIGLMVAFARVYSMLAEERLDPDSLTNLLTEFRAVEPRRLRRLKRRVFGFQRGTPLWQMDAFNLLGSLANHDLGNMVYASDASLDRWLRLCWERDAARTVEVLATVDRETEAPQGPLTAREGLSSVFEASAPDLITPNTVGIAAALQDVAVARAIWGSNNAALWTAWADLDPPIEVPNGDSFADFTWAAPLTGSRHSAAALSRVLRAYPEALDHLIVLADDEPAPSDLVLDLAADAKRLIRYRLEHDGTRLRGLARLADTDHLPRTLNVDAWTVVVRDANDAVVVAVAYLIARKAGASASLLAVDAFTDLYRELGREGANTAAWDRLSQKIGGDRGSWDRCDRLAQDFAQLLRTYPTTTTAAAVERLRERDVRAASAVEQRIRSEVEKERRKKFRIWDPTTW